MSGSECPSRDQISQYAAGRLSAITADLLEEHLSNCEACAETFNRADQSDPLLSQLKTPVPADQSAYLNEPAYKDALSAASQLDVSSILADVLARRRDRGRRRTNLIGRRFGQYELEELIGQGGMGMVYRARHVKLDRRVAFKVLPHSSPAHDQLVQRFEREMQAVGRLQHPNIVQAFDADEMEGIHYLAMEYVDGPDLSALLKKHGTFPVADACEVVRQAAVGLQHAYENGLVHRDVKPGNLMLDRSGTVKLLDLGLALLQTNPLAGSSDLTSTGQLMGTVDYMAPEQAENTHEVDIRADIYSLGATLYALLTGAAPFAGVEYGSVLKKMAALANDSPKPIRDRRPELPVELAVVVDRMVARDPASRFSTPADVAAALTPFAAGSDLLSLLSRAATVGVVSKSGLVSESSVGEETVSHSSAVSSATETAFVAGQSPATRLIIDPHSNHALQKSHGLSTSRRKVIGLIVGIPLLAAIVFLLVRNPEPGLTSNGSGTVIGQRTEHSADDRLHSVEDRPVDPTNQNEGELTGTVASVPAVDSGNQATSRKDGLRKFLMKGGRIVVQLSGRRQSIYSATSLPEDDFQVVAIYAEGPSISDADLKSLGSLPALESVKLFSKSNDITSDGLRQIASWSRLRVLTVSSAGMCSEESLGEVANLNQLRELALFVGGRVTGEWLGGFREDHPLEKLVLSPHLIFDESGMERLSKLTNLKSLTLTGHIVTAAGLKHLASLKKLEKLQIRETVPAEALRQLGENLPSLVSLSVGVSATSLPLLQAFTNLEGLHLLADGVPDAALLSLQTLNNLKFCRIEGDSFTAAGIAALQNKLPECMIVAPDIAATTSQ